MSTAAYAAFFDVDGTLLNTRSLLRFLDFVRSERHWDGEAWFAPWLAELGRLVRGRVPRQELNAAYFRAFRGQKVRDVEELGARWYAQASVAPDLLNPAGVSELRRHQEQGARTVLVSGSFLPVLRGLRDALGCHDIICTELEESDGRYSGRLLGEPCIGPVKAERIVAFAARHGLLLARCFAYGDDDSDAAMLGAVGCGRMVSTAAGYRTELEQRSWL
jgi:HAD superfamily hydrolase (TIGR01490 family)